MPPPTRPPLPLAEFATPAAWEAWLEEHHANSDGVRLKFAKKGSGVTTVTHAEALELALCFGWIDGQVGKVDERFWCQRFTPRTRKSPWSQINRRSAIDLTERGWMRSAGLAEVERAKQDGRWDRAYEPQSKATVPDDFQAALSENPKAEAFFATLTGVNRYAFLYRIQDAKRPDTRARRIAQFVEMCAEHRTLH
jgi:uncharacterized protein YdeI (YjbR/CyaY-like superfamily)